MMASIKKRPDGRYRARYRDLAGKEHSRHFGLQREAQDWLNEVTSSVVTGTYVDPKRARATVGTMAAVWLDSNPDWAASTRARNSSVVKNYVLPKWGDVRLADMDVEVVQRWIGELSASTIAPRTVRKVASVLSSIMDLAITAGRAKVNPVKLAKLPKHPVTRRRYLTAAQVETMATAAGDEADLVLTLAYCGLRVGELAALRVRHVDMLRRRFRVEEAVTEVDGKLVWSAPKDHQRRSVPFPSFLADMLAVRLEGTSPDDLVFPSEWGKTLRVRNMRRYWFDRAAADAGVEGLTPHELRHTAASLAVSAGANVLAVQRMLGHDKPSTTLDVYSDLFDEDLDSLADRLDGMRSANLADFLRTTGEVVALPAEPKSL
ncbi:tyrosine-type recombinase/integrase [Microlunatus sp. Y2014]|uniref:tyrosine-type recombinase/integrase n=1 Tax=Microlunatus sp. Y2014 TaxID=3418488 RepID=UPI003DA7093B